MGQVLPRGSGRSMEGGLGPPQDPVLSLPERSRDHCIDFVVPVQCSLARLAVRWAGMDKAIKLAGFPSETDPREDSAFLIWLSYKGGTSKAVRR